ncbi:NAD(P)H-hydrate dehydratase [Acuticoccus sp. M5D2P5]|uniref:NAD(P)H-hydrate dehydratase n=1 Tax=Acuticoccus kalidii TaxID=2910977 RepID=UPI001F1D3826|nr:NAD(P)H-hydrate dehydratase [Acuticoccus kalidii]MCF3933192.1 NAD(P)H-hydrate dehydratase [Acuticoccus kalidii]
MIELPTPYEMSLADRKTAEAGTSIATLMERAGYAVADLIAAEVGHGARIAVLAGPGDNGGDAFVAARILRERGYHVALVDLAGEAGSDAARAARTAYRGPHIEPDGPEIDEAGVVIDGLFGGGLSRDIEGVFAALIERVNAADGRVFAIDLPSGIDGATGAVRGVAIRAHRTITFERRKPGHLLMPGRAHCGRVSVASIGIDPATIAELGCRTFANEPDLWKAARPTLAAAGHKYDRGHAIVLSGPMTQTGAARLSAMAALRAGAGLVTLASPGEALLVNACHLTTVMLAKVDDADELGALLSDTRKNVVCLGPGLDPDEATRAKATAALASEAAVVLDAGAVTAFAGMAGALAEAIGTSRAVLTPHEGEFGRVFSKDGDKLARARAAAEQSGAVIVLKGRDTVIAAPDGRAAINTNAPPYLATAGSGDVLCGIVTGFLAQGVPPFEAAAMAVFLHGETASRVGPALIADDLIGGLKASRVAFDGF